jgi:hypothetical protein
MLLLLQVAAILAPLFLIGIAVVSAIDLLDRKH